jgi:hypothetical protein
VAPGGAIEDACGKKSHARRPPGFATEMSTVLTQTWNRKPSTVYTRVLARATEIAGSTEALAEFLASSSAELGRWATGTANPPMPIFLAMVDVVAANALTSAALENLPVARARRSSVAALRGAA